MESAPYLRPILEYQISPHIQEPRGAACLTPSRLIQKKVFFSVPYKRRGDQLNQYCVRALLESSENCTAQGPRNENR